MAQSTVVGHEKEVSESVKEPVSGNQRISGQHLPEAHRTTSASPTPPARAPQAPAHAETAALNSTEAQRGGLRLDRYFSSEQDPFQEVVWEKRQSVITNPDGSVVFKMEGAEIPSTWSQLATDIVVSKYFRKAGLHGDKHQECVGRECQQEQSDQQILHPPVIPIPASPRPQRKHEHIHQAQRCIGGLRRQQ